MNISIYVGDLIKEPMLSSQSKFRLSVDSDPVVPTQKRQPTNQLPKAGSRRLRIIQGVWKVLGV